MWPCIVTNDRASWHVTVHRDMWPYIVTSDRASWHVTVHRDVWPCIVTCDRASWQVTVHRNKFLCNKPNQMHQFHKFILSRNSTCFGQFVCPASGFYSLHTQQWYMSYRFVDSFRAGAYAPARKQYLLVLDRSFTSPFACYDTAGRVAQRKYCHHCHLEAKLHIAHRTHNKSTRERKIVCCRSQYVP
jgi:hypothetical protein